MRATKAERWIETLEDFPGDIFSSTEATLEETERVKQRLPAYKGVSINELNSEDMGRVYQTSFFSKYRSVSRAGSYDQFKTTTDQFVRMLISILLADRLKFYKKGKIFLCIENMSVVQALTSYFQIQSSSSTLCGKSRHLLKLAFHAEIYFSGCDDEMNRSVAQVREFF